MIIFIHGSDTERVMRETRTRLASLQKKRPGATVVELTADTFDVATLEGLVGGQGLFEEKVIVHLNRVLESKEAHATLADQLEAMCESPNGFVITETVLETRWQTRLAKHAERRYEHNTIKASGDTRPFIVDGLNLYTVADALTRRERARFWELVERAKRSGAPVEMLFSIVATRIHHALMLVRTKESGGRTQALRLTPNMLRSAQETTLTYSEDELRGLARSLIAAYREERQGGDPLWIGLEKIALDLR